MKKKYYIVKHEVIATSIGEAIKKRGRIFEVIESDTPVPEKNKKIGFVDKKKK